METKTKGRVYVTLDYKNEPKYVSYYDKKNKRYKQIDFDHFHKINGVPTKPHTHKGYVHNEKGDRSVSEKELKMIERVTKIWYHYHSK